MEIKALDCKHFRLLVDAINNTIPDATLYTRIGAEKCFSSGVYTSHNVKPNTWRLSFLNGNAISVIDTWEHTHPSHEALYVTTQSINLSLYEYLYELVITTTVSGVRVSIVFAVEKSSPDFRDRIQAIFDLCKKAVEEEEEE